MNLPTHAQPTAARPAGGSSRMADLCRTDPALWARVVRRQDWYEAQGWHRDRAAVQAEVDYGIRPVDDPPHDVTS